MIKLRPAGGADADLLLDWANDSVTRATSFHPEPIDRQTHLSWYAGRLADPATRILIGLRDGIPVGQVRLTRDAYGAVEVGISVAAEHRGRGVGRMLLGAAIEAALADRELDARRFVARIRPDNAPSIALFTGAGFSRTGAGSCNGVPCLYFERETDGPPEAAGPA